MTTDTFAIVALDHEDAAEARARHREAHLSYYSDNADRICVSGPLAGEQSGSLIILRCDTETDARAFIEGDPFFPAGVWRQVDVFRFKVGAGVWAQANQA